MPNPWKQNERHSAQENQASNQAINQHLRLQSENITPDIKKLQAMLDSALRKMGTIVEMPFVLELNNQVVEYLIMVQWEKSKNHPIWTMYKNDATESKVIFSEEYPAEQMDILHDVIVMTTGEKSNTLSEIPEELKFKEPVIEEPEPAVNSNIKSSDNPQVNASDPNYSQSQTGPIPTLNPNYPQPQPGYPPPQPGYAQPNYSQPQPSYQQPGYPPPQPGYPQPQPGYPPPQPGYQQPQPSYQQPQQGYQQPQPGYPPNYPDPYSGNPNQSMTQIPVFNANQSYNQLPAYNQNKLMDYDLVSKPTNVLIGELLVSAGLINENSLKASLKIQELVKEGKILLSKAGAILKKYHERGSVIDQFLDNNDWSLNEDDKVKEVKSVSTQSSKPNVTKSGFSPELEAVFDLLVKAGIITQADLDVAIGVRKKHGGSVVQILQAAQKMDQITFDCARTCLPIIKEGLMKVEQCVIVINYSSRSRVSFDEALNELNWVNPRKLRKDLQL